MSFGVLERDSRMGLIDQVLVLRVVIDHPADYRAHDSNRFPCAPDVVKGLCDQLGSYAMVAVGGEHRRVPQRDPVAYQPVSEVSDLLVPEQSPVDVLVLVVSDRNLIIRRRNGDERPAGIRVPRGPVGHVLADCAGPLVEPLTVIAERPGHLHWPPLLWRARGALGHWCGSPSALGSGRHPWGATQTSRTVQSGSDVWITSLHGLFSPMCPRSDATRRAQDGPGARRQV